MQGGWPAPVSCFFGRVFTNQTAYTASGWRPPDRSESCPAQFARCRGRRDGPERIPVARSVRRFRRGRNRPRPARRQSRRRRYGNDGSSRRFSFVSGESESKDSVSPTRLIGSPPGRRIPCGRFFTIVRRSSFVAETGRTFWLELNYKLLESLFLCPFRSAVRMSPSSEKPPLFRPPRGAARLPRWEKTNPRFRIVPDRNPRFRVGPVFGYEGSREILPPKGSVALRRFGTVGGGLSRIPDRFPTSHLVFSLRAMGKSGMRSSPGFLPSALPSEGMPDSVHFSPEPGVPQWPRPDR